ncbi:MAG: MBL fold metallo-hydrolase [Candidatus Eisenbacteria bacterium]|nr:MBL fold metallo-hydrolase [Candidatus Eisenbacteria bacterium]
MTIAVLASGSSGNAMVVSSDGVNLVIDAGVSARRLAGGLRELSIGEDEVSAVLVTHEHHDHVCGLGPVSRRLASPVVATRGTHGAVRSRLGDGGIGVTISPGDTLTLGGLEVTAFATSHDCAEPVGYAITDGEASVAVATDLGVVDGDVRRHLANADCVVLESNHDEKMLVDGRYPWHLKRRIMGRLGHLSNAAAAAEVTGLTGSPLSLLVLAHLSKENNDPGLAVDIAAEALDGAGLSDVELHVASQELLLGPLDIPARRSARGTAPEMEPSWTR